MFRRILLSGLIAGLLAGIVAMAVQQIALAPLIAAAERGEAATAHHDHDGEAAAWTPAQGIERGLYSLLADLLTGVGFGLMLTAGLALHGRADLRHGLLWGLAGYAAWSLAPAAGLPPELPGSVASALGARQVWWLSTALMTSAGLALLVFARSAALRLCGLLPIALPHLIGAPSPEPSSHAAAALSGRFVIASLAMTGLFWLVLGGAAAIAYRRLR